LKAAYKETHYRVHHEPPFTLLIGKTSQEMLGLFKQTGNHSAAFITAWNPYSKALPVEQNHQRQNSLRAVITARGLSSIPGIGQHPSNNWPGEESLLILGIDFEAVRAVARKFEQWAFVWIPASGIPELVS